MWAVCITLSLMVLGGQAEAGGDLDKFDHDIEFEAWSEASDMEGDWRVFMIDRSDDVVTEEIHKRASRDLKMKLPATKEERQSVDKILEDFETITALEIAGFLNCTDVIKECDDYAEHKDAYCDLTAYKEVCTHTCDDLNCNIGDCESCGSKESLTQEERLELSVLFGKKLDEEIEIEMPDHNPQVTCPEGYYKCEDMSKCIGFHHVCDGIQNDCPNNDDENEDNCPICDEVHQFECDNKECISISKKCDEEYDCGDGSDEDDCLLSSPTSYSATTSSTASSLTTSSSTTSSSTTTSDSITSIPTTT